MAQAVFQHGHGGGLLLGGGVQLGHLAPQGLGPDIVVPDLFQALLPGGIHGVQVRLGTLAVLLGGPQIGFQLQGTGP